ncbi:elongation factor G [Haloplasma contractile]|uniref:Elongation factor G n=1 Tax=Haloplasma contractile SSD-17B TaxID=1033810 RepID=F7Q1P1_9MOLU|nr:elongation factor G [Haloplasma contractile]ERJ12918.1 Protein Translation Elongation Factor G [Haloplasma contractile SSD-17B]
MKLYSAEKIRNIAILGHQSSGKTTLSEAILNVSGITDKKGIVEKGSTVSDYSVEEKKHNISIQTSLLPVEWKDHKYNILDTPGYSDFIGEVNCALRVVRSAIIVIDATKGVEVGTENAWRHIRQKEIPAIIFINKMDKENIKFNDLIEEIRQKLGKRAVPFAWPIGRKQDFEGFVNVVDMKARIFDGETCVDAKIWDEKREKVDGLHNMIVESVAETSEELMEKYFEGDDFSVEEIHNGLRNGVLNGELTPILVGSSEKNVGIHTLLDMLSDYLPAPTEMKPPIGINPNNQDERLERHMHVDEPFSAYVFKTIMDPFLGQINLFKVRSGKVTRDQEIYLPHLDKKLKMGPLFTLRGKEQIELKEVVAGDICAVAKMNDLSSNDTFCDFSQPIIYKEMEDPSPTLYMAMNPKNKHDEDKISDALHRLNKEYPTFKLKRNKETHQYLIGGQGMTQLEHIVEKLKNMFNVNVTLSEAKVVYRETIKSKSQAQGKFKKQSGGSGQYGDVHIRFEPTEDEFLFAEEIFGGSVPRNYIPAVEKGLKDAMEQGVLAGFPVIGLKAVLYDGSYHAVDSSELAFKMAASLAYKKGLKDAIPTILEPIMKVKIHCKDEFIGDLMGDLNKRRGRVQGMTPLEDGWQTIEAEVPEVEMLRYNIDLKAMTQGSAYFSMDFERYDEVPAQLQDRIIKEAQEERLHH